MEPDLTAGYSTGRTAEGSEVSAGMQRPWGKRFEWPAMSVESGRGVVAQRSHLSFPLVG